MRDFRKHSAKRERRDWISVNQIYLPVYSVYALAEIWMKCPYG
jgi:hypothetical protein